MIGLLTLEKLAKLEIFTIYLISCKEQIFWIDREYIAQSTRKHLGSAYYEFKAIKSGNLKYGLEA